MKRYLQLVVDVDGYEKENRDAILAAAEPILDWSRIVLGDTEGFMQYDGSPPCDGDGDGDEWSRRIHDALVSANGGAELHTMFWFYELEPFECFEFGAPNAADAANDQDDTPVEDADQHAESVTDAGEETRDG